MDGAGELVPFGDLDDHEEERRVAAASVVTGIRLRSVERAARLGIPCDTVARLFGVLPETVQAIRDRAGVG